jgi:site-specific DNA recombinase
VTATDWREKLRGLTPEELATTAVYTRVSRDREGAGLACERQETELRELVERLGLPPILRVYPDNDLSAYSLRKPRPNYGEMLEDIAAGRITHVVAWHSDRLHRNLTELESFCALLERHGVTVQTKHGGLIDLATPGGRANAGILGVMARMESEIKTERIRSKHVQLAQSGKFNGGGRRWGYEPGMTAIREDEANMIRGLAAELLSGASLQSLARKLTEEGWQAPRGGRWHGGNLGQALARPHLAGLRVHHGQITEATWPAILDTQTHEAVKALLGAPSRRPSQTNVRKYVLSGLARCGVCDSPVISRPGPKGRPQRAYSCPGLHVFRRMDLVDKAVRVLVADRLAELEPHGVLRSPDDRARVAALQAEDEVLQAREEQFADDYADGTLTGAQFFRASKRVRGKREAIAAEQLAMIRPVRVLEGLTGHPVDEARDLFDALPLDRKRAVIDVLCTIHIDKAAHRGAAFDPDLIRVTWKM